MVEHFTFHGVWPHSNKQYIKSRRERIKCPRPAGTFYLCTLVPEHRGTSVNWWYLVVYQPTLKSSRILAINVWSCEPTIGVQLHAWVVVIKCRWHDGLLVHTCIYTWGVVISVWKWLWDWTDVTLYPGLPCQLHVEKKKVHAWLLSHALS